jgi:hypothetical protein
MMEKIVGPAGVRLQSENTLRVRAKRRNGDRAVGQWR